MPGLVDGSGKRKRGDAMSKPTKRLRSESLEGDQDDTQGQILLLENEIFESKKNYNNVTKLLRYLQKSGDNMDNALVAAISLCRVFVRLMASGEMTKKKTTTEKALVVISWLHERYNEYKQLLFHLLSNKSSAPTILTILLRTLKAEGARSDTQLDYNFPTTSLKDTVRSLLLIEDGADICREFGETYLEEHDDLRFYFYDVFQ